jgi:hypothetical protein
MNRQEKTGPYITCDLFFCGELGQEVNASSRSYNKFQLLMGLEIEALTVVSASLRETRRYVVGRRIGIAKYRQEVGVRRGAACPEDGLAM